MKTLRFLAVLALTASTFAQTSVTTRAGAVNAIPIAKTTATTITGALVFGGIGDAPMPEWSGKVVIVDRGTNTFAQKVNGAKAVGAVGVIIANTAAGQMPKSPTLDPDSSTIPAVFVTFADGATLKAQTGALARVGSPTPVIPEPFGKAGEWIQSDGSKYVLTKSPPLPAPGPVVGIQSDVEVGKPLSFSVSAQGTPPFTYQWIKDGANITGATTAVFSIPSATTADAGSYVCQVSNEAGSSPSAPHVVTVTPPTIQ